MEKLLVYCKNAPSVPMSIMPATPSRPPLAATMAYVTWERLFIIGPIMLPRVLAAAVFRLSSSLSSSKRAFTACSWQNTFTTFCPSIISSI